jgi:hypothetical protein
MTFKLYGPPPPPTEQPTSSKKREKSTSRANQRRVKKEHNENESVDGLVVSPTTVLDSKPITFRFEDPVSSYRSSSVENKKVVKQEHEEEDAVDLALVPTTGNTNPKPIQFLFEHYKPSVASMDSLEGRYYTHFIDEVSTLLLIYDNSLSINPFRRCFPDLSHSSPSMASAMEALGALHLANTSSGQQRNVHFQNAMSRYGEVVKSFRTRYNDGDKHPRLPDFATCLLLALFEVFSSAFFGSNIVTLADDGFSTPQLGDPPQGRPRNLPSNVHPEQRSSPGGETRR